MGRLNREADDTKVEEDPNDVTPGGLGWKKKTLVSVVEHMSSVHSSVRVICDQYFERYRRRVYVTPKSFLTYITSFKVLYKAKHKEVIQLAGRIVEGLKKMLKAQVKWKSGLWPTESSYTLRVFS